MDGLNINVSGTITIDAKDYADILNKFSDLETEANRLRASYVKEIDKREALEKKLADIKAFVNEGV